MRSKWKVTNVILDKPKKKFIKIYRRELLIFPSHAGLVFSIHNGRRFKDVKINAYHFFLKAGELHYTRSLRSKKKIKKIKKKK